VSVSSTTSWTPLEGISRRREEENWAAATAEVEAASRERREMSMRSATLSFFGGKEDELAGCGGFEAVGVEVVAGAELADGFGEAGDSFAAEVSGASELGAVGGSEGREFAFEPGEEDAGGGGFEEEHLGAEAAGS